MVARQTRRLSKWALPFVFLLVLFQPPQAERTAASTTDATILSPGQSIQQDCSAGTQQTFALWMEQEQLLQFAVLKGDLAIAIEAYKPNGTKILEHVSHSYETIESSLVSETAGSYKIVIRSLETSPSPRSYELRLRPIKVLTKEGRLDHEAQKLIAGGTILRAEWTKTSLQQAIEKYDGAALIWKGEGNLSAAAQALLAAGEICFLLSDYSNALKRYQTAEQLAATANDELDRSRALNKLGLLSSYLGNNDKAQVYLANALRFLESTDEVKETRYALAEGLSNLGEVTYSKGNLVRSLAQL